MREIVHIQAGQCGNQIGAKVRVIVTYSLPCLQCDFYKILRLTHFLVLNENEMPVAM